jgi:hypothetical protein
MIYPTTKLPRTHTLTLTRRDIVRNHIDIQIRAQLGSPGRCPDRDGRSTHVLLYDNSGSVVGFGGNDCVGRRFEETKIALDLLGHACRCRREMVGVVHFDTGLGDAVPAPVGTRDGLEVVEKALRIPSGSPGISTVGPALAVAERFARSEPLTTLLVLSDFALTDTALVTGMIDARPAWAEHVHLVTLGTGALVGDQDTPPWITVTSLGGPGEGHAPGDVAKAIHQSFTRTRRPTRRAR